MRRANDYWRANNNVGSASWNRGAYYTGNHRAFRVLGERVYHDWEVSWGDANGWKIGPEGASNADAYACGQTYIDLYRMDLRPVYLADIKAKTDALVASPAVDGWWWIDAFYMQGPVLARLGNLTGDTNYFNKLWLMYDDMKTRRGLFDPVTSLWWRDASYTNQVTANGKKVLWSRGNGWVFAGLARVLQQMSTNSPHYADYVAMFQTMAPALRAVQGADGMWRSNLDDYDQYPNPETSGTGFFTYGLAWGVRNGLLPAAEYTNTIALAWQGLTNLALQASGRVGWVQNIGAAPAATTASNTTDFGVGAFLLAGSEIYLMASNAPAIRPWAGPDQSVLATNGNPVTIPLDASQTEIYRGTALSYTWWEGSSNFASGVTASATLAVGEHVIRLQVLGSDGLTYTDSMSVAVVTPPPGRLFGAVIGSPGSWNNVGNTITNVFDGNLNTFYDAANSSGDWAGLDFGAPKVLTQIRYAPRAGFASRMVNGVFQAANNSNFTGAVTLFTITNAPPAGVLSSRTITDTNAYRYARYLGPVGGNCNVAEVEFYGHDPVPAFESWQWQYFGCTNCPQSAADADPLGKGISNTNQFLLGLNPTNPASLFRIVSATPTGDDVVVTWQAGGGRTNVVQAATGSLADGFVDLPGSMTVLAGSGDVITNFTDTGGATNTPVRVYRVRFVP